jgi:hypothetical protein
MTALRPLDIAREYAWAPATATCAIPGPRPRVERFVSESAPLHSGRLRLQPAAARAARVV